MKELQLNLPNGYWAENDENKTLEIEALLQKLNGIADFKKKLQFYNKNIRSLSTHYMQGQIYFPDTRYYPELKNLKTKIYCGCLRCRNAGTYNAGHEKIYHELRDKDVKRLVADINKLPTYKEKLIYLLNTKGYSFTNLVLNVYPNYSFEIERDDGYEIMEDMVTPVISLTPETKEEITTYNDLLQAYYESKIKDENGNFTNAYNGFNFDTEREEIEQQLAKAQDPEIIIDNYIKQIEKHFDYPYRDEQNHEAIIENVVNQIMPNVPLNKHINRLVNDDITGQRIFQSLAYGNDIDLNKHILREYELKHIAHVNEIFKFYTYLKELIKTDLAPIKEVPFIGNLNSNLNISDIVKDYYYGLVPQPVSKSEVSEHYVGKLNRYNPPFAIRVYGAYPLMIDWEHLDNMIKNKTTPFDKVSEGEIERALQQYASGFKIGYFNFEKDILNNSIFNNDAHKTQTIFDFVTGRLFSSSGFPFSYGKSVGLFGEWKDAGKEQGYIYRAWYLIFENYHAFTALFENYRNRKIEVAQQDETEINNPTISLFCNLVNEAELIKKGETETVEHYCKKVCTEFNLSYTDKVRQGFLTSHSQRNIDKIKQLILPKIPVEKSKLISEYLEKKQTSKQKLYG